MVYDTLDPEAAGTANPSSEAATLLVDRRDNGVVRIDLGPDGFGGRSAALLVSIGAGREHAG